MLEGEIFEDIGHCPKRRMGINDIGSPGIKPGEIVTMKYEFTMQLWGSREIIKSWESDIARDVSYSEGLQIFRIMVVVKFGYFLQI